MRPKRRAKPKFQRCMNANDFMRLMKTWDKGGKNIREMILKDFVEFNDNRTALEIDAELYGGGSLFLTRITAWLRLTYLLRYNLAIQIAAIRTFVAAPGGNQFLQEFLEVGGIFTLLEIIAIAQTKDLDKSEAMRLLRDIAKIGIQYREFICECYGVKAIADYLSKCKNETGCRFAKETLLLLSSGTNKFLPQVYKAFISIITSNAASPQALQLSCQALRNLIFSINTVHSSIVDATLGLLRNSYYEVQYEGTDAFDFQQRM
ncbi:hypothetical protein ROZALSC1DRAFT_28152 [Rozella allomycis CSF55]|uniref:ARM repeat-containing protein n=1 Tax=Rozella allomycis (strain CSF55) TaxID=988480 RepID=A0A4P9YLI3_ROZAC|nr:hypothetical protein ROZALSC1DRAFT_28152 [Rozella allomycis CSF55]